MAEDEFDYSEAPSGWLKKCANSMFTMVYMCIFDY